VVPVSPCKPVFPVTSGNHAVNTTPPPNGEGSAVGLEIYNKRERFSSLIALHTFEWVSITRS
jgi:hypothetical protein